jgi:hypothetical protein
LATPTDIQGYSRRIRIAITAVRRRVVRSLGIAVLLLAVSSCASTESSDSSRLVVGAWDSKTVSTLCVEGEEDYGSGANEVTPVQEGVASFFGAMVVDDGCDATITISLTGEARSATYDTPNSPESQLLLYTGAGVQGAMSLTADGESPLNVSIGGTRSPPQSIVQGGGNPRAPLGAPFWGAAYDSVCIALQHWFGADDPNLSPCPEPVTVTFTTVAGHTPWSEEVRAEFLDGCVQHESMCLCLLYAAESVLTEAEWIGVRDIRDISLWPEDIWARVAPVWDGCSP